MAENPNPLSGTMLLTWKALDAYPHERSPRWYLVGGVLVLAIATYGLLEGSWSTTLVALSIGGVYFLLRNKPPRTITVAITGLGVRLDGTFTPWNLLRTFWILAGPTHTELHIMPTRFLQPEITAFINSPPTSHPLPEAPSTDTDPAAVRETLLRFLPERAGMEERFLDSLAKILKL